MPPPNRMQRAAPRAAGPRSMPPASHLAWGSVLAAFLALLLLTKPDAAHGDTACELVLEPAAPGTEEQWSLCITCSGDPVTFTLGSNIYSIPPPQSCPSGSASILRDGAYDYVFESFDGIWLDPAADVVFSRVVLRQYDEYSQDEGWAPLTLEQCSNCTLNNVEVDGVKAWQGAVLRVIGGSVTIANATWVNLGPGYTKGDQAVSGAAIEAAAGASVTLLQNRFQSLRINGGTAVSVTNGSSLSATECSWQDVAPRDAGSGQRASAITVTSGGSLTLESCSFDGVPATVTAVDARFGERVALRGVTVRCSGEPWLPPDDAEADPPAPIYALGTPVELTDSTVLDCSGTGAIRAEGAAAPADDSDNSTSTLAATAVTPEGVTAAGAGTGTSTILPVVLRNLTVVNCSAPWGGALRLLNCATQLLGGSLRNNSATSGEHGLGGAVLMLGGTLNATGARFLGNSAAQSGGALAAFRATAVSLHSCNAEDNTAWGPSGGGALFIANVPTPGAPALVNATFSEAGAPIPEEAPKGLMLSIEGSLFARNSAGAGAGGAVQATLCPRQCAAAAVGSGTQQASAFAGAADSQRWHQIVLRNCSFEYNAASAAGGALNLDGDGPACSAACGGAGSAVGAGVRDALLTILSPDVAAGVPGARFLANRAASVGGGAVAVTAADVWIEDTTLEHNVAPTRGAALVVDSRTSSSGAFGANTTLVRTVFDGNVCGGAGTGTFSDPAGGALAVMAAKGSGASVTAMSCTFSNNACSSGGAASLLQQATASFLNTTFTNNTAAQGYGGALFLLLDPTPEPASISGTAAPPYRLVLQGSRFEANDAMQAGGALWVGPGHQLSARNCIFEGNGGRLVPDTGGAVHLQGPEDGSAPGVASALEGCRLEGNTAQRGGAVYCLAHNLTIGAGSYLADNRARFDGGAVYASTPQRGLVARLVLQGTALERNVANETGGALSVMFQGVAAAGCSFLNNTARLSGGALFAESASLQPLVEAGRSEGSFTQGELELLQARVEGCSFEGHHANNVGGAVYAEASTLNVTGSSFSANRVGDGYRGDIWSDSGAAIFATACFGVSTIHNTTFTANMAQGSGGALMALACNLALNLSTFTRNAAYSGGALAAMDRLSQASSLVDQLGGAGGIAAGPGASAPVPDLVVVSSTFRLNLAQAEGGGAIYASEVNLNVFGSSFEGNRVLSRGSGGAVACMANIQARVQGCEFLNNSAQAYGGAFFAEDTRILELSNNTLSANAVGTGGGALALHDCGCTLLAGTQMHGNTARAGRGGGLHLRLLDGEGLTAAAAAAVAAGAPAVAGPTDASIGLPAGGVCRGVFLPYAPLYMSPEAAALLLGASSSQGAADPAGDVAVASVWALQLASAIIGMNASGNVAATKGGAIALEGGQGRILLDSAVMTANVASMGEGGAIAMTQGDDQESMRLEMYLTSSLLEGNTAAASTGGALAVRGGLAAQQVAVLNTTLRLNSAQQGGAVSLVGNASLQLSACRVSDNAAAGRGGGLLATACGDILLSGNTTFERNTAGSGAACSALSAAGTCAAGGGGGGVAADGGGAYVESCARVLVRDSAFNGNVAAKGGGLALRAGSAGSADAAAAAGASVPTAAAATLAVLMGTRWEGNRATAQGAGEGLGGALHAHGRVTTLLADSSFSANSASGEGGALMLQPDCDTQGAADSVQKSTGVRVPAPTAFPGVRARLGGTLDALAGSRRTACSATVMYRPAFFNNSADGIGGAVFATRPEALWLVCGTGPTNGMAPALGGDDDAWRVRVQFAMANASYILMDPEVVISCYSEEIMQLLRSGNSSSGAIDSWAYGLDLGSLPLGGNQARGGYGSLIGLVPSQLRLVGARWSDRTNDSYSLQWLSPIVSAPGAIAIAPSPADGSAATAAPPSATVSGSGRRSVLQAPGPAPSGSPLAGAVLPASALASSAVSAGWVSWDPPPQLQLQQVEELDPLTGAPRKAVRVHLVLPNNRAVDLGMQLLDALDQLAADRSTYKPSAVVRVSASPNVQNCSAQILGSEQTLAVQGEAVLRSLRLRALKGEGYKLNLAVQALEFDGTVEPLSIDVTVPSCPIGYVPEDGGYLCRQCDLDTFTLWVDDQPLVVNASDASEAASGVTCTYSQAEMDAAVCHPCPDSGVCPGGAVMVPEQGFWHSAANSTFMHACPNSQACREGDDKAQNALLECQRWWYSRPPGFNYTAYTQALLSNYSLWQQYSLEELQRHSGIAADQLAALRTFNTSDGAGCVLWGAPPDSPVSYMQSQCTQGYRGRLCAVCESVNGRLYAGNSDFQCRKCLSQAASVVVLVLMVLATLLGVVGTLMITFMADYTQDEDDAEIGDYIKVLIVHMQFFIIITRLNIPWPDAIDAIRAVASSITGSFKQVYSPSCLLDYTATSAHMAAADVGNGLVMPLIITALVAIFWVVRYRTWFQGYSHGQLQPDGRSLSELLSQRQVRHAASILQQQQQQPIQPQQYDSTYGGGTGGAASAGAALQPCDSSVYTAALGAASYYGGGTAAGSQYGAGNFTTYGGLPPDYALSHANSHANGAMLPPAVSVASTAMGPGLVPAYSYCSTAQLPPPPPGYPLNPNLPALKLTYSGASSHPGTPPPAGVAGAGHVPAAAAAAAAAAGNNNRSGSPMPALHQTPGSPHNLHAHTGSPASTPLAQPFPLSPERRPAGNSMQQLPTAFALGAPGATALFHTAVPTRMRPQTASAAADRRGPPFATDPVGVDAAPPTETHQHQQTAEQQLEGGAVKTDGGSALSSVAGSQANSAGASRNAAGPPARGTLLLPGFDAPGVSRPGRVDSGRSSANPMPQRSSRSESNVASWLGLEEAGSSGAAPATAAGGISPRLGGNGSSGAGGLGAAQASLGRRGRSTSFAGFLLSKLPSELQGSIRLPAGAVGAAPSASARQRLGSVSKAGGVDSAAAEGGNGGREGVGAAVQPPPAPAPPPPAPPPPAAPLEGGVCAKVAPEPIRSGNGSPAAAAEPADAAAALTPAQSAAQQQEGPVGQRCADNRVSGAGNEQPELPLPPLPLLVMSMSPGSAFLEPSGSLEPRASGQGGPGLPSQPSRGRLAAGTRLGSRSNSVKRAAGGSARHAADTAAGLPPAADDAAAPPTAPARAGSGRRVAPTAVVASSRANASSRDAAVAAAKAATANDDSSGDAQKPPNSSPEDAAAAAGAAATTAPRQPHPLLLPGTFSGSTLGGAQSVPILRQSAVGRRYRFQIQRPRWLQTLRSGWEAFFTVLEEDEVLDGQEHRWASLQTLDRGLAVWQQELLVVMVSAFVLYPGWATSVLSIFACFELDDRSGPYPQYQMAAATRGYWIRNMDQQCFTGVHSSLWVPIGIVCIVFVCVGIPALTFGVMWWHRRRLNTVHVVQTYGFLFRRYRPRYYYWEAVVQVQTLLLILVDVFGRVLPVYQQAVVLQAVLVLILTINAYFNPVKHSILVQLEYLSLGSLTFTVSLGLLLVSPVGRHDPIGAVADQVVSAIILIINFALGALFAWHMWRRGRTGLIEGWRRARSGFSKASQRLMGSITMGTRSLWLGAAKLRESLAQRRSVKVPGK